MSLLPTTTCYRGGNVFTGVCDSVRGRWEGLGEVHPVQVLSGRGGGEGGWGTFCPEPVCGEGVEYGRIIQLGYSQLPPLTQTRPS